MSEISDFFFENNIFLVLKIKLKTISFEIDFAQSANRVLDSIRPRARMKSMVGPHLKKREAERNQRDELTASTSHTIRFSTMIYIVSFDKSQHKFHYPFSISWIWLSFSSFSKWVVWFSLAYRVVNCHLFCWMLYLDVTFCSIMVLVIVLWGTQLGNWFICSESLVWFVLA